jgi:hypothetical protein
MTKDEIHRRFPYMNGTKLTPCLQTVPKGEMPGAYWLSIDIGIWHDASRPPHLSVMVYYDQSGKSKYPAAGRLDAWETVHSRIRELWKRHACEKCDGKEGGCADCGHTGWGRCLKWLECGGQMDGERHPVFPKTKL